MSWVNDYDKGQPDPDDLVGKTIAEIGDYGDVFVFTDGSAVGCSTNWGGPVFLYWQRRLPVDGVARDSKRLLLRGES
jgi:hypothetical protein